MAAISRVAVVTGANKGIGLAIGTHIYFLLPLLNTNSNQSVNWPYNIHNHHFIQAAHYLSILQLVPLNVEVKL